MIVSPSVTAWVSPPEALAVLTTDTAGVGAWVGVEADEGGRLDWRRRTRGEPAGRGRVDDRPGGDVGRGHGVDAGPVQVSESPGKQGRSGGRSPGRAWGR